MPPANREEAVIQFRSGTFFRDLDDKNGTSRDRARVFPSKGAADAFMREHEWILFNGGMAVARRG